MFHGHKLDAHARLMGRMANVAGVNLDTYSDKAWIRALELCSQCTNLRACEDWLDAPAKAARMVPGFCKAAPIFCRKPHR